MGNYKLIIVIVFRYKGIDQTFDIHIVTFQSNRPIYKQIATTKFPVVTITSIQREKHQCK